MQKRISPSLAPVIASAVIACGCDDSRRQHDPLQYLFRPPAGRFLQVSSYDTTGGNRDRLELASGDSATLLDVTGPGVITRIWITVSSQDPHYLRRIALRIYWDGETEPSVALPLGDFFGNGFEKAHFGSLLHGVSSGGFYSYLPMPFRSRARIVIDNGTGLEIDAFYYQIGLVQLERMSGDMPTLHVWWNRTIRTDRAEPHVAIDVRGSGRFVGLSLNAESYLNTLDFLEGDEAYVVDGEFRGQGTGTEDYFNSGWYFDRGTFAAPYHGLVMKDESRGRIAAYRWHIPDPIDFAESLRVELEHGHANEEVADYATVAYWYQREPHVSLPPLPPADRRRTLDVKIPPGALLGRDLTVREQETHVVLGGGVARPDRYEILVYPVGGPGLGSATFQLVGDQSRTVDLAARDPWTIISPVSLGSTAADSQIWISMTPAEAQVPAAVWARPIRRWATEWNVVGPFPNPRVLSTELSPALDSVFSPEGDPSLATAYVLRPGERLTWKRVVASPDGQVRLNPHFTPNDWVAAYAQAFLHAPSAREAILLLGADDAHVLWVNGERVSARQGRHISRADDIEVHVRLQAGWNRVLIKVADLDGGWAFQMRVADPRDELRWSADAGRGS